MSLPGGETGGRGTSPKEQEGAGSGWVELQGDGEPSCHTTACVLAALGYLPPQHSLLSPPQGQHTLQCRGSGELVSNQSLGEELAREITWPRKSPGAHCI